MIFILIAGVAQLVERRTENPYVVSSILTAGSFSVLCRQDAFFLFLCKQKHIFYWKSAEKQYIIIVMDIRIPPFLHKGCTIAVTAPSFGCVQEPYRSRFAFAKAQLEAAGYAVHAGKTVFKSDGKGIATDPRAAAAELEALYCSQENAALISAGGGELMCETAGCINFEKIRRAPPKWFLGYSDNTNFIFPLVTLCRIAAVYGPCFTGFGKKWERTERDTLGILEGTTAETCGFKQFQLLQNDSRASENLQNLTYCLTEPKILRYFPEGSHEARFSGTLLGGCLDVLANLCGTHLDAVREFNRSAEKIIWVLESCDANPAELRRQIWHLKNALWFEKASGFLVGRPLASFRQEMMGINQYNAVTDLLADFKVPVIMDVDIGHIDPVMPVVMGATAEVFASGNELRIAYASL